MLPDGSGAARRARVLTPVCFGDRPADCPAHYIVPLWSWGYYLQFSSWLLPHALPSPQLHIDVLPLEFYSKGKIIYDRKRRGGSQRLSGQSPPNPLVH